MSVELGRPENEIKEHKGTHKGHAKERAGITKDTNGTTSTFLLSPLKSKRTPFLCKPTNLLPVAQFLSTSPCPPLFPSPALSTKPLRKPFSGVVRERPVP